MLNQVDEPASGEEANFCHPVDNLCEWHFIKVRCQTVWKLIQTPGKVDVHYATRGLQGWPKLWVQVRFMMMTTINMTEMIIVIMMILMIVNLIKAILMTMKVIMDHGHQQDHLVQGVPPRLSGEERVSRLRILPHSNFSRFDIIISHHSHWLIDYHYQYNRHVLAMDSLTLQLQQVRFNIITV